MKKYLLIISLITLTTSFAGEHSLGAHEHGAIKLGIAVDNNYVDLDLDGPTESFISFEYLPKTEKEKKIFNDIKNLWEKSLFDLITFEKKMDCKIANASFTQVIDQKETAAEQAKIKDIHKKESGVHSDIEAKAKIMCNGNMVGTQIQISLKKYFKNIKKLNADVLSMETKTVEITKPVQSFQL